MATLPELEQNLNLALLHLHQSLAHAFHVLQDAERSLTEFDARLAQRKTRLRAYGYALF